MTDTCAVFYPGQVKHWGTQESPTNLISSEASSRKGQKVMVLLAAKQRKNLQGEIPILTYFRDLSFSSS